MSSIKVTIQLDSDTPAYGPGSVLQGVVRVENAAHSQVDRLLILFHGSETLIAIPNGDPYSVDGKYHREQFFGSQRVLWNQKFGSELRDDTEFPFIIQLPMVQFPPSMDIANFYSCRFQLASYLQGPNEQMLAQDSCPVTFMPQIETRLSKEYVRPVLLEAQDKQQRKFKVQLDALGYIPGDVIQPLIYQPPSYRISMKLFQVFTIRTKRGMSKQYRRPVAEVVGTQLLDIPEDLIPSFGYGRVVSVSYELRVSFLKPAGDSLFSLKSSYAAVAMPDIPIRIGTLGYGIRPSDELQVYTAFKSIFAKDDPSAAPCLPAPKYVSTVEYKDALPLYEDYQLPAYQER
ncbi:hypothetical protein BJV82DRAFT_665168 [Fennellomyces sp. T-0311]|nr:hypothetical protein BJV82DRAFT_665168 [Fennellomyces sp. T-0311]